MDFCKTVDILYAALPLRPFRNWLIRVHIEGCPRCQAGLLSREEARGLLVASDAIGDADALWQRILSRSGECTAVPEPGPVRSGLVWQWVAAAAMTLVVALTGFWLFREVERPGFDADVIAPAGRFQIDYINVGGAPAHTFVYQPQGTDTVFVWASRTP